MGPGLWSFGVKRTKRESISLVRVVKYFSTKRCPTSDTRLTIIGRLILIRDTEVNFISFYRVCNFFYFPFSRHYLNLLLLVITMIVMSTRCIV